MKNEIANTTHEHIYSFVASHNIDDIIYIESQDPQFLAISHTYHKIKSEYIDNIKSNDILFLDLVTKISLITYQIGGTWEDWWNDVMNYIYQNWSKINLEKINDTAWRNELLQNTKYNRRLKNMKLARLSKIWNLRDIFDDIQDYKTAYEDMYIYHTKIIDKIWAKSTAKTPLFATKMFGYICRVIFGKLVVYPDWLSIPIDSRLTQIYNHIHNIQEKNDKDILVFFDDIAQKNHISSLHLDSLLWLKYWKLINIS